MPESASHHCVAIVDKDHLVVVGTGSEFKGTHMYYRPAK